MRNLLLSIAALTIIALPSPAHAQKYWEEMATKLKISVLAKDGLFIGTEMGGVHVKMKNRITGDTMAEGKTWGSPGDQDIIMKGDRSRDSILVDENSASFDFSIAILEPTPVTISVTGPLAQPQSMFTTSQDYVLLPDKDYSGGNGIIIELAGLVVDVLSPVAHQRIKASNDKPVIILANLVKLSGGNIEDNSPWPPENYEVQAYVYMNGKFVTTLTMQYAGNSQFISKLLMNDPGPYLISVAAFDPLTKESGVDSTTLIILPADETE